MSFNLLLKDTSDHQFEKLKNEHYYISQIDNPSKEEIDFLIEENPLILVEFIKNVELLTTEQCIKAIKKEAYCYKHLSDNQKNNLDIISVTLNADYKLVPFVPQNIKNIEYLIDFNQYVDYPILKDIKSDFLNESLCQFFFDSYMNNILYYPKHLEHTLSYYKNLICFLQNDSTQSLSKFNCISNLSSKEDAIDFLNKKILIMDSL